MHNSKGAQGERVKAFLLNAHPTSANADREIEKEVNHWMQQNPKIRITNRLLSAVHQSYSLLLLIFYTEE